MNCSPPSHRFEPLPSLGRTGQRALLTGFLVFAATFLGTARAQQPASSEKAPSGNWVEAQINSPWKYSMRFPGRGWFAPEFDDSAWKTAPGGFGTTETPGARVWTTWGGNQIWLRKWVELPQVYDDLAFLLHHDEDVEVYLNGKLALQLEGWTTQYEVIPLDAQVRQLLHPGRNLLAVHCRQTTGGQFIDVHLVRASQIPELPAPPPPTAPHRSDLITPWGEEVDATNAWTEYPRPQMRRSQWRSLNGWWQAAVAEKGATAPPTEMPLKILVPFCLESRLGGVWRLLSPEESLWYRRSFELDAPPSDRLLLHFDAVDYQMQAWINGKLVGEHTGGFDPFTFDITEAVQPGQNELVVRVLDATAETQLRGKQHLEPHGIWYTRVSGIWQSVWLEEVPQRYIEDVTIGTSIAPPTITVAVDVAGQDSSGTIVEVAAVEGESELASGKGPAGEPIALEIPHATLWTPDNPRLYDLRIRIKDKNGELLDEVASYAGIREVGRMRDAAGHWRFTLNGEPIFHWGPLDQGWWPDGLLTPPSDEAMQWEIQWLKDAGFNMIRKHIKVEPRRYYYHCDRVGMLVWQDQVSASKNPKWTRFDPHPEDAPWTDEEHAQYMLEFERMIDNLENHPSIVVWTPFNEAWGQHRTMEVGRWTMQRDPSRLVNIASGGNFWPVGHIADWHQYPHPDFPFDPQRFADYIKVVGEFGGHGWPVEGHLWDPNRRNWGYGSLPQSIEEYHQRITESLRRLQELKQQGIAAGVYTQTTDVEGEINGLMTYDRKVIKIPAKQLRSLSRPLLE
ncbi:MAG: hydrolase [Pirellulaceae bacterium]|nr:MAG: hydrolase [Pirellulaceae bacterium]